MGFWQAMIGGIALSTIILVFRLRTRLTTLQRLPLQPPLKEELKGELKDESTVQV
jgi:hypothetical protein